MKSNSTNRGNIAVSLLLFLGLLSMIAGLAHRGSDFSDRLDRTERQTRDLVARLDVAYQAVALLKQGQEASLGATNKIPDLRALYEDSLATKISASATSFTLTRGTSNGTSLASSTYPFIIDEGTSNEEFVLADCTGTACTNVTRGLSLTTGTTTVSALQKAHGRGASVKITDGPILLILNRILQGVDSFPNTLYYQSLSTTTQASLSDRKFIPTGEYVDFVGSSGCSNASATTRGCIELATQIEAASSTSAGSTGANLVIPASMATSSPGTAGLWSVVTNNAGKIAQAFLDLTESFTFAGSVTHSATTTVQGTAANKFIIRALEYVWPSAHLTNGFLKNNGSGTLSWATLNTPRYTILDQTNFNSGTSTEMLSLPAGTITASSTIKVSGNYTNNSTNCQMFLRTTSPVVTLASINNANASAGYFTMQVYSNNSVSSQEYIANGFSTAGVGVTGEGTSAADFTNAAVLVLATTGDGTCTVTNFALEVNP